MSTPDPDPDQATPDDGTTSEPTYGAPADPDPEYGEPGDEPGAR